MIYIVIAYDIEDDRQRNRIAKLLLDAGLQRVQKSVFEGYTKRDALKRLQGQLKKQVKSHDSIRYYSLCGECRGKTEAHGIDLTPEYANQILIH